MSENNLKWHIIADHTKFEKGMNKAIDIAKRGGKAAGVGIAAGAVTGTAALVGVTKVMSEAIELANIQEEAEAKLGAVLKATGEAAGYNKDQLVAMAGAMQGVTTVGDETIIAGQAILATFKEIKGDAFEGATKAALDMSAVMGQDLKSSMVQIGKALNDPIKGLTALSRVGVSFTEEQKEQIKVLQESGDMMGAQKIILQELESEFGGAAAALRDTYGGAVTAASNAFGDLEEQIGFVVTKNNFFIEGAKLAEQTFVKWTGNVKNNEQAVMDMSKTVAIHLVGAIDGVVTGIEYMHLGWLAMKTAIPVVVDSFMYGADLIYKAFRKVLMPIDGALEGLESVSAYLGGDFINPLDKIQAKLDAMGDVTQGVMEESFDDIIKVKDGYTQVHEEINAFKDNLSQLEAKHKETSDSIIRDTKDINAAVEVTISKEESAFKKRQAATDAYILKLNAVQNAKGTETDFWLLQEQRKQQIEQQTFDVREQFRQEDIERQQEWVDEVFGIYRTGVYEGMMETFGETENAWDAMWKSMLATMVSVLAEMAARWVASEVAQMAGWAEYHHDGLWLSPGEHWAIIQDREMVIPASQSDAIRENLGEFHSGSWNQLAAATGNQKVDDWTGGMTLQLGQEYLHDMIGGIVGALVTGGTLGDAFGYVTSKPVFQGNVLSVLGDKRKEFLDFEDPYTNTGAYLGRALSLSGLTSFNPIVAELLETVGGWAGGKVGDLLNDRKFEELKDAYEDGFISKSELEARIGAASSIDPTGGSTLGGFYSGIGDFFTGVTDSIMRMVGLKKAAIAAAQYQQTAAEQASLSGDYTHEISTWSSQWGGPASGINYGTAQSIGYSGGSSGSASYNDDTGGYDTYGGGSAGFGPGLASGGSIRQMMVPTRDHGFVAVRNDEGIIDPRTMQYLSKQAKSGGLGGSELVAELRALRAEVSGIGMATIKNTLDISKLLQRLEINGFPTKAVTA